MIYMKYAIEKHLDGYCLVSENGNTVATGAPHMKSTLYFDTKKEAQAFAELLHVDTFLKKEDWTPKHWDLFKTIPEIVRRFDGDLFEIKWYGHSDYDGMMWEVEHNLLGKDKLDEFKAAYDSLTNEHKNLIYYAYEA